MAEPEPAKKELVELSEKQVEVIASPLTQYMEALGKEFSLDTLNRLEDCLAKELPEDCQQIFRDLCKTLRLLRWYFGLFGLKAQKE